MGLVQSVKERALGEPNCSLMVSIRKLSGRWRQAAHGDEMRTNSRHKSNQERFRLDIRKKFPSMRTTEQWIWLHNKVVCCFQPWKFSGPDWPESSVTWSDLSSRYSVVSSFDPVGDDPLRSSPTWIILLSFLFQSCTDKQIEYLLICPFAVCNLKTNMFLTSN